MFTALVMTVGLVWPQDCIVYGDLYRTAAIVRDSGVTLKRALADTQDNRVRLTLIHVYERKDMNPEAWYWFAIGVCTGLKDEQKTVGVTYAPRTDM